MRLQSLALLLLWLLIACSPSATAPVPGTQTQTEPTLQATEAAIDHDQDEKSAAQEVNREQVADATPTLTIEPELTVQPAVQEVDNKTVFDATPTVKAKPTVQATKVVTSESEAHEQIIEQIKGVYPSLNLVATDIDTPINLSEWVESEPEEQGMDSAQLAKLAPHIEDKLAQIHSVVVVRNGVLVYEYYKEGRSAHSGDLVWSVTKSVTSILVGIAIDEGLLQLDNTLADILVAEQLAESNPTLATVTIHDLLTMTAGMVCPGDRCHDKSLSTMLAHDLSHEPGTTFIYDTGATHLLSAVLQQVTGMPLNQYAAQKLFVPLGIEPPPWEIDTEGNPYGGKGIAMLPRDMAKVGQLVLDEGTWRGTRVVSANYIDTATQNQVSEVTSTEYGYLFWIKGKGDDKTISAVGYGGQYITIVPKHELVVVITSDFLPARSGSESIIEPFIIEAIVE